jgi:hypothetical protein
MIKGQGEGPNADAEITEGYMPQIPIIWLKNRSNFKSTLNGALGHKWT